MNGVDACTGDERAGDGRMKWKVSSTLQEEKHRSVLNSASLTILKSARCVFRMMD